MKRLVTVSVVALFCLGVMLSGSFAGDKPVTVEGQVLCAKCTLHEHGQEACQNVLVVEKKGKEKHFYLTKNEVYEDFGSVCKGSTRVRVVGTIADGDDGHRWITATEISPIEDPEEG